MPSKVVVVPGFGVRTLHFNDKLAKRLYPSEKPEDNGAYSPNDKDIYIAKDWISGYHLAHEWGHGEDARRLGWRYLLWITACFVKAGFRHDDSEAEKKADAFRDQHWKKFPEMTRL